MQEITCTKILHVVLTFLTIGARLSVCLDEEDTTSEFIPTKEWQRVEPGQQIPPGLHVRMDLAGGGRWAKLMDEDDKITESKTAVETVPDLGEDTEKDKSTNIVDAHGIKLQELKQALKNMKEEKKTSEELLHDEQVKEKFRSMDEIKSEFEKLNLKQESDFEAMKRLLTTYKATNSSPDIKVLALQDIEYYVHQVDNANDFMKIDGFQTVLEALNHTHVQIREEAAHVIGSAVQSNPSAQVKAVEVGILQALLRMLGDVKQPMAVRKKAMYATSALVRNFPAAQYFFNNAGGFGVLSNLFKEQNAEKLQFKAVSLINDLVVERRDLHSSSQENQDKEKLRQYNLFSLSSVIDDIGLCEDVAKLIDTESHDWREVVLKAMRNLHGACKDKRAYVKRISKVLPTFKKEYKRLLLDEEKDGDKDSFFHHMHNTVSELLTLFKDDKLLKRDEL